MMENTSPRGHLSHEGVRSTTSRRGLRRIRPQSHRIWARTVWAKIPGNFFVTLRVQHPEATLSDSQLIESTLAGDSTAFGQLVRRYQDRLFNTLVYVMGNAEDARDVAQDAFVKAFVKLDTFQQTSAFYTWLYRIAFNLSVTHRRRTRPTLSLDQTLAISGEEPVDDGEDPAAKTEEEERRERLWVAINGLNEEYRTVLVLREIEGCRYESISEILDLPIGTIRSRLHRARAQLREKLKGDWISED